MKSDGNIRRACLPRLSRGRALLGLAALAMIVVACQRGSYAVDIFPEQHYAQSYRNQEPPRLGPAEGAVPITGKEVFFDFQSAKDVKNPVPRTQQAIDRGAEVFRVNCSMCHGKQAQGDGSVGNFLVQYGHARPPNLTAPTTQNKADGEIFWLITNGVVVMPQFKYLVKESDRWAVVDYLRFLAEQNK